MASNLLPCPFCGFPAEMIVHGDNAAGRCTDWKCPGHVDILQAATPVQAADAWNKRAPDTRIEDMAMLIKRMALRLKGKAYPTRSILAENALSYLRQHDLLGSPMREEEADNG